MIQVKKWFRDEQGAALVMVLVLAMMFGILGISLIYVGITHHENILKDELKLQAYYAAEAGIIHAVKQIENDHNVIFPSTPIVVSSSDPQAKLQYTLQIKDHNGTAITVQSIGNAYRSNKLQATATISVKLDKSKPREFQTIPFFNYSIYSNDPLILGQEKVNFNNWKASWSSPIMKFSWQTNDQAILKNKIESVGNIYSSQDIKLYDSDQINGSSNNQYLGIRPKLMDGKMTTPSSKNVYKTGYNIIYLDLWLFKIYYVDSKSKDERDPKGNLLTNTELNNLYGENLSIEKKTEGNVAEGIAHLENEIRDNQDRYNMKEYSSDLHITKTNTDQLNGWLHVKGNLIIDEGVTIEHLNDLLVLVDGGIYIGAKSSLNSSPEYHPVKLHGNNIILIAKGNGNQNWKNIIQNQSSIRDTIAQNYVIPWIGEYTTYHTSSYMNSYANDPSLLNRLSILINEGAEIDGWVIGKQDVVMDYPISSSDVEKTIKINGGIVGEKILFPKSIQIAKDLFIYDWKVEYN
ncbi:pilus assembly PilX N-terminal domain-containing protein [Tepidibacillus sp. LV47]|uniref:pilus assembly PilX N-terminal domain-containing protein n=1 Tax=Tepidibacillus sp. LV47 TaxID=3398228 RepID=UPI003AAD7BD1